MTPRLAVLLALTLALILFGPQLLWELGLWR
jgi:hypothetical protein